MNRTAASQLAGRLAAVDRPDQAGAVIVGALIAAGAEGALAWLASAPGIRAEDLSLGGALLPSTPDEALIGALGRNQLDAWLSTRGAAHSVAAKLPGPTRGIVAAAWQSAGAVPPGMGAALELVAGQAASVLRRTALEQRFEAVVVSLQNAELQIERTRRVRALGDIAVGVAHDFNNFLTSILGFAELGLGDLAPTDRCYTELNGIRTIALDAATLVRRLQSFSRRGLDDEREVVDLRDIVRSMPELARLRWTPVANRAGVTFEMVVEDAAVPLVHVMSAEIRELLLNLVFNAIDAMPSGGRITIGTRAIDGWAEVAVADQGTGMPPDVQARIFEPFFSTKAESGSGLGLSVSRSIAERHGGVLEVKSTPGAGTRVALRLPPAATELLSPHVARGPAAAVTPSAGLTVLLVDDQEEVRSSVGEMLRALGHVVTLATDGESALALLSGRRADVVVTDYGMPGLNGIEFAQRLQAVAPGVPVVLLTGWDVDPDVVKPGNIAKVQSKPVTIKALAQVLDACQWARNAPDARRAQCS